MKKYLLLAALAAVLASCSNPVEDLKSPCVGDAGSPCDRRPVNGDHLADRV